MPRVIGVVMQRPPRSSTPGPVRLPALSRARPPARPAALSRLPLALALCAVLAACQSSEEKAEGHFAAAQSLLAEGDTPRALVELRNTLDNKQDHIEARLTLARLLREQGDLAGAWSQYQTLAQQRPDDITIRVENFHPPPQPKHVAGPFVANGGCPAHGTR